MTLTKAKIDAADKDFDFIADITEGSNDTVLNPRTGQYDESLPHLLRDAQSQIDTYLQSLPAIEEAPNDGKVYVRVNNAWVEFVT